MAKSIQLSLCFPAYNEAANLPQLLEHAQEAAVQVVPVDAYEIIVVDDGSTDATKKTLTTLQSRFPLTIVTHDTNQGYGASVKDALQKAQGALIFYSDADNQFDLKELKKFMSAVQTADAAIGYRAPRRDPWRRRLAGHVWNWLARTFFPVPFHDMDCAFKLFRADKLLPILEKIQSRGAAFSPELLLRLRQSGATIIELPVAHFPRQTGQPTGLKRQVVWRALKELARLYRNI